MKKKEIKVEQLKSNWYYHETVQQKKVESLNLFVINPFNNNY